MKRLYGIKIFAFVAAGIFMFPWNALAAQVAWERAVSTNSYNSNCSLAMDGSGNVYTCGYYTLIGSTIETRNYVMKFSPEGNLLWNHVSSLSSNNHAGVAVDGAGNVFATDGTNITKYSPSGQVLWNAPLYGWCSSLGIDPVGNTYVGGYGAYIDGTTIPKFVSKISSTGNLLWTTPMASNQDILHIAVDASGNSVVAASNGDGSQGSVTKVNTNGTITWSQEYLSEFVLSTAVDSTGATYLSTIKNFIKYDSANNKLWSKPISDPSWTGSIAIAPNGVEYLAGGNTIFKYDSSGNLLSSTQGVGYDLPQLAYGNGRLSIEGYRNDNNISTYISNIIVPEPSTLAMLTLALGGLLWWRRRS